MKKFYPYIFPAAALLFVFFLLFRWYNLRTQREGMTSLLSDGVKIENLEPAEATGFLKGTKDFKTENLEGAGADLGEVRYEVKDGKVSFTVSAVLPKLSTGKYQVWLKETDSEGKRKAMVLEYSKGGYVGSASISSSTLPFEIIVSKEMNDDAQLEEILLKGMISEQE
ncbi:MAG: hypothetical protein COU63_01495 [Candidatus Pacebacteria bacterium CG10_big_fil_rev_8_21_14_0_10_36_11]|nr:hypothetical protein [Candidatus Pacearchaeota archaeon]OIP73738.1 MAG: hypothetical protein AUK08_04225 [Candidatus Pacebacteria bacterium CG2_30_36_39]PIR64676.1 MAG: hypothetical protein COU63_01495 [Candidatus Pacebacteria bacterium CG10_big_fil_rev_8_21_14_0_10_36_11]PJC42745.1 MAG: hypothetical protein CO040_02875 [Candidatus Pacebacteria bacterium CG_4_9_14_0_2_um_filter_36_8]